MGICTEHFQEWLLMGHLLLGKREHSTEGSLLEQHIQLPDLRVQHGYEFALGMPHTGQPIMLHVSDTAPLQVCPLAQEQRVSQGQSRKEWKNNLCRHRPCSHCEFSSNTARKSGRNHTWVYQSMISWIFEQPLGRYSTG